MLSAVAWVPTLVYCRLPPEISTCLWAPMEKMPDNTFGDEKLKNKVKFSLAVCVCCTMLLR